MKIENSVHISRSNVHYVEVSFTDLPDDVIVDIFKLLDLPSRLKMRVNKRLNVLQGSVRNDLEEIEINVRFFKIYFVIFLLQLNSDESELIVTPTASFAYPRPLELNQLEHGIRRLIANCKIARISIGIADFGLNEVCHWPHSDSRNFNFTK